MKNLTKNIRPAYFIELIIVIIGVSIAFWLSEISQGWKEDQVRRTYLEDIQTDLKSDKRALEYMIRKNEGKIQKMVNALQYYSDVESNKDSIIYYATQVGNYYFFTPEDYTYQSLTASGDFKLLENKKLKKGLLKLHTAYNNITKLQDNYLEALDQNYFPFLEENFDYAAQKPTNSELYKSLKIKNAFAFSYNDLNMHIKYYKYAGELTDKLDSLIVKELKN